SRPLWSPAAGGAMLLERRPPRRPLRLVVTPFRSSTILLDERPVALVFLSDPDATLESPHATLCGLYQLTPAECRLTNLLAQGSDLACAATQLSISVETARFHLKQVFRKTGTNRQSELVRLILGLPAR
ncbi:MAG: helix-turn-helix transcriptional regulator, partial [Terracidiphilus sp.]